MHRRRMSQHSTPISLVCLQKHLHPKKQTAMKLRVLSPYPESPRPSPPKVIPSSKGRIPAFPIGCLRHCVTASLFHPCRFLFSAKSTIRSFLTATSTAQPTRQTSEATHAPLTAGLVAPLATVDGRYRTSKIFCFASFLLFHAISVPQPGTERLCVIHRETIERIVRLQSHP